MLWGILAAAAFVLAAAKYAARRMCGGKYDRLFLQIHKLAGALLPVSALVHGALMVRRSPTAGQTASGACAALGIFGLMASHFFAKKLGRHAMPLHRFFTVFTGVALVAHLIRNVTVAKKF
ncbi:MAG: hypothetical protein VB039_00590 [Oscillospiraceae bacterium]|nr:hypothetical protein [Oscillospiraceae bacterium]